MSFLIGCKWYEQNIATMLRFTGWIDDLDKPTLVTFWSAIHFMTGALWHVIWRGLFPGMSFQTAFLMGNLLHALYETKDFLFTYTVMFNPGRWLRGRPDAGKDENTLPNSITDTVFAIAGFLLATCMNLTTYMFVIIYVVLLVPIGVAKQTGLWHTD